MIFSKGSGDSTKSKEEYEESSGTSLDKGGDKQDTFTSIFSDQQKTKMKEVEIIKDYIKQELEKLIRLEC